MDNGYTTISGIYAIIKDGQTLEEATTEAMEKLVGL